MRTLLVVAALGACCLFIGVNSSSAADHGQVPSSMLAQMGLSTMQPMSDVQGLTIRGMGRKKGGTVTIQANVVVQAGHAGSSNGGAGGSVGSAGGNGGDAGSVQFNNSTAAFIQVNVNNLRLGGGIVMVP